MARQIVGDSCGCAMGARFLAVALIVSGAWYAWQGHASMLSTGAIALRILGWSFLAALVGKVVGILVFRAQRRKLSA
jgi:hypothetical protein